jgi:transposase-like protein
MTHQDESSILEDVLKVLSLKEPGGLRNTIQVLLNAAMKVEQEEVLKADHYERSAEREAYRNGYKDKTVSTRLGKITVHVPQVFSVKRNSRNSPHELPGKRHGKFPAFTFGNIPV